MGIAECLAAADPRRKRPVRSRQRSATQRVFRMAISPTSFRRMAVSACPSSGWKRSMQRRFGPGTRSASAAAPGPCRRTRRKPARASCSTTSFHELLPPKGRRLALVQFRSGHRTGGMVRPQGADRESRRATDRQFSAVSRAAKSGKAQGRRGRLGCGVAAMTSLPRHTEKKLGLVIDLDICVGCHACVVACKEWNTGGYGAPLADTDAYGESSVRGLAQPRPHLRGHAAGCAGANRPFPEILPALRQRAMRHCLPDRRFLQAQRGRHRAGR